VLSKQIATWAAFSLLAVIAISTLTFSEDKSSLKPKRLLVESTQPDFSKWESLKVGMTETEVRSLLGKPIWESEIPERFVNDPNWVKMLVFGRIRFDSQSMPDSFDYWVDFQLGKLTEKHHPFGGEMSRDGRPSTPVLIYPRDRAQFDHYPRFVDLRWNPSSGQYPIDYVVDVEIKSGVKGQRPYNKEKELVSELPYAAFAFGGKSPGRWRVKATNALGESEWSEWRLFEFEQ
jgi:hypothetical protein